MDVHLTKSESVDQFAVRKIFGKWPCDIHTIWEVFVWVVHKEIFFRRSWFFFGSDWSGKVVAAHFLSYANFCFIMVLLWRMSFLLKSDRIGFRSDTAVWQVSWILSTRPRVSAVKDPLLLIRWEMVSLTVSTFSPISGGILGKPDCIADFIVRRQFLQNHIAPSDTLMKSTPCLLSPTQLAWDQISHESQIIASSLPIISGQLLQILVLLFFFLFLSTIVEEF